MLVIVCPVDMSKYTERKEKAKEIAKLKKQMDDKVKELQSIPVFSIYEEREVIVMSTNKNLHNARKAKNDEFYTRLEDIQAELNHYKDKFKGKVVFCNCDDPFESNFVKFFLTTFFQLGLKELIATGYYVSPITGKEFNPKTGILYKLRINGDLIKKHLVGTQKDLNLDGAKYILDTEQNRICKPLLGNYAPDGTTYYPAGDFRSDMCLQLLKECDVVVTNPPFSLAREYVKLLFDYNKSFLIIGDLNWVTEKEIFPLIKDNKIWLGNGSVKIFEQTSGEVKKFGNKLWFTNLDQEKRHKIIPLNMGYKYKGHENDYPQYDNYDAINVDKVSRIPCDYEGIMGVPITFLDKYNPEQFEIIGIDCGDMGVSYGVGAMLTKEEVTKRFNEHKGFRRGKLCYRDEDGKLQVCYRRILIRRKKDT